MPLQQPHRMTFPVTGVSLLPESTDCSYRLCKVVLSNITRGISEGTYKCEVSSEAPKFDLVSMSKNVTVAGKPEVLRYLKYDSYEAVFWVKYSDKNFKHSRKISKLTLKFGEILKNWGTNPTVGYALRYLRIKFETNYYERVNILNKNVKKPCETGKNPELNL